MSLWTSELVQRQIKPNLHKIPSSLKMVKTTSGTCMFKLPPKCIISLKKHCDEKENEQLSFLETYCSIIFLQSTQDIHVYYFTNPSQLSNTCYCIMILLHCKPLVCMFKYKYEREKYI